MAKYLNIAIVQALIPFVVAGALWSKHQVAIAQALTDPTRPPATLVPGDTASISASNNPVLQSVLISSRRTEAIINGRTVRVGDRVGDQRVASIAENEVTLQNGKTSKILRLFPNIEKRSNPTLSTAKADKHQQ